MTDIMLLAKRQFERIEWQNVPDAVTREDQTAYIADSIRDLLVMTGRGQTFSEDMFIKDDEMYVSFDVELKPDEIEYVLAHAEVMFYRKVQTTVNELTSYTTDAMAVAHGDKPFANLQQTINDARTRERMYWFKMPRYHTL